MTASGWGLVEGEEIKQNGKRTQRHGSQAVDGWEPWGV